ncbi:MAG: PRC-barrel domain-containing protein [Magnetospirillum sp.]|nr:PRC-barrel domain-containing protein [Magnetospirillum sp.]
MKHSAFVLAAGLALALPLVAVAQEQAQHEQQQGQAAQAQLSADAHHVIDKQAVNTQGKEVGKVKDVLIGQDGRVQALVVDVKGKNRAVPWNDVSMKADQLTLNMNDQQLSQLPEYRGEKD